MKVNDFTTLSKIDVLLIEDNPGDIRLLEEALLNPDLMSSTVYNLEYSDNLANGLDKLKNQNFSVVLLDLTLPDSSGFETFLLLKDEFPDIPVVVLSGIEDEELAIKVVQNGGQDYLVKGYVNDVLLNRAIKYAIERKQLEILFKKSLREKEVLLKEIHHRVKNNLQVISSLLSLQAGYISEKKNRQIFEETKNRVKSIAIIHEKLYYSDNIETVDFREYIESLISNLFYSYGITDINHISRNLDLEQLYLNLDTAIPCGLLINELVSNSLKYAFDTRESENIISISLKNDNHKYLLKISDNGIGLASEIDFENTNTLGLQLVKTLVDQLDGEIIINREKGTEYLIYFSEIKYKDYNSIL